MTKIEEAQQNVEQAEIDVEQALEDVEDANKQRNAAYDSMIEVRADYKNSNASESDVKEANAFYKKTDDQVHEATVNLDACEKALVKQKQRLAELREAEKTRVEQGIQEQLPGVLSAIEQAHNDLQAAIGKLEALRNDAKKQLGADRAVQILPIPLGPIVGAGKINLNTHESRNLVSLDNWLSNYKSITNSKKTG